MLRVPLARAKPASQLREYALLIIMFHGRGAQREFSLTLEFKSDEERKRKHAPTILRVFSFFEPWGLSNVGWLS